MRQGLQAVRWLDDISSADAPEVGEKHAFLGEVGRLLRDQGARVPQGFVATNHSFVRFLDGPDRDAIASQLDALRKGHSTIRKTGEAIRSVLAGKELSAEVADAIAAAYRELARRSGQTDPPVAIRSSLSSAGQGGLTVLNVSGEENVLDACLRCYHAAFTDRAIAHREQRGDGRPLADVAVAVQRMVRSGAACAGNARTWDPDTGFPRAVVIESAWGAAEGIQKGGVSPDRHMVFTPLLGDAAFQPIIDRQLGTKRTKLAYTEDGSPRVADTTDDERRSFVLTDREVLRLARWVSAIERLRGKPAEMEWAKDGDSGEIYIVDARAREEAPQAQAETLHSYRITEPGERLLAGLGVGEGLAKGRAFVAKRLDEADRFPDGGILVTGMATADWEPIIRRAGGLVTDFGSRTSEGAVLCRELGIPAVLGAGQATRTIRTGQEVTLSCSEGEEGVVYSGTLEFEELTIGLQDLPQTRSRTMLAVSSPAAALRWWKLPSEGIGLATIEYILANTIKVHPMAAARFKELSDRDARRRITSMVWPHEEKSEYVISNLAHGIAKSPPLSSRGRCWCGSATSPAPSTARCLAPASLSRRRATQPSACVGRRATIGTSTATGSSSSARRSEGCGRPSA
jgi:pyruvate,water dikinase